MTFDPECCMHIHTSANLNLDELSMASLTALTQPIPLIQAPKLNSIINWLAWPVHIATVLNSKHAFLATLEEQKSRC